MKLRITHLKAPWPVGAKVGDVLDLPAVPVWAAGKCERAADAAVTDKPAAIVTNIEPQADSAKAEGMLSLGRGRRKG